MSSQYDSFFYWLGQKETGSMDEPGKIKPEAQYLRVSINGYLGKYQMGEDILADLGYYSLRHDPTGAGFRLQDWRGVWTGKRGIRSRADFLKNPEVQEIAIREAMRRRWQQIRVQKLDQYIGKRIWYEVRGRGGQKESRETIVTEAGLLAATHLVGSGQDRGRDNTNRGVIAILKYGKIVRDGNGVDAREYLRSFGGFQTPFDLVPERDWYSFDPETKYFPYLTGAGPRELPQKYIWFTQFDEKVRQSHRSRHRAVFYWDNPPPGGHPGSEKGCRCWAESVIASQYVIKAASRTVRIGPLPYCEVAQGYVRKALLLPLPNSDLRKTGRRGSYRGYYRY